MRIAEFMTASVSSQHFKAYRRTCALLAAAAAFDAKETAANVESTDLVRLRYLH